MHPRLAQSRVTFVTSFSLLILAAGMATASGDDTGILGRLFRFGSGSSDPGSSPSAPSQSGSLPYGRPGGSAGGEKSPNAANPFAPAPMVSNFSGLPQTPVTTPPLADGPALGLPTATYDSGRHLRRPRSDPVRAGTFQRWQPVWHVLASLR